MMIWVAALALAGIVMVPLLVALLRRPAPLDRREAALALHRAQLDDLARDAAEGRIAPAEHATAMLEVQRRLLAAEAETPSSRLGSAAPLLALVPIVPIVAISLYLIGGQPEMPGAPMAARMAAASAHDQDMSGLVDQLRTRVTALDPKSPQAREGYVLLGSIETSRGNYAAAAAAWRVALAAGFDPTLAARTAETITAVAGRVTPEAADLFRRALAQGAPDAAWRPLAEQRLAQAQG